MHSAKTQISLRNPSITGYIAQNNFKRLIRCQSHFGYKSAPLATTTMSPYLFPIFNTLSCWSLNDRCFDGCDHTSSDGTRGRACDASCQTGVPFGTFGCSARDEKYGGDCRVCYNDIDKAINQMDKGNTAVM